MQFKDEDLREFQALWKRAFGEEISPAYAHQRASELVTLYLALAKPLPEERGANAPASHPPIPP